MPTDLEALARKLEGAEEGSPQLSWAILEASGWRSEYEEVQGWLGGGTHYFKPDGAPWRNALLPDPTRSLDDALRWVVPEGWLGTVSFGQDRFAIVEKEEAAIWNGEFGEHAREISAEGHTPALALCAASLRARNQSERCG